MALQFRCPHCGENVIVKYLKVGEFAQCHQCGNRTEMPSDAGHIDDTKISTQRAAPTRHPPDQRLEQLSYQDYITPTTLSHLMFSPKGRTSRSSIWAYSGLSLITLIASIFAYDAHSGFGIVLFLWWVAMSTYTGIMVEIKRFHDRDKSGWWVLAGFVPLFNILVAIELLFLRGTRGPNRYGADPLENRDVR